MLGDQRLGDAFALIDPTRTRSGRTAPPRAPGDTTYLCVVDRDRTGVSLIQSNASGFGSWMVEPSTGVNLHNRGLGFSLVPGHPAEYGPGRRPPHTLAPALVTAPGGRLRTVLGTMGGDAQPQVVLQLLARLLHHGQSPATAIAAGRFAWAGTSGFDTWAPGGAPELRIEGQSPERWDELSSFGHRSTRVGSFDSGFGHAHLIDVVPNGSLAGAADPRARVGGTAGVW
ncbi:MAG: gamma-glutamyltransferase [Ilumatobacteraceae bacterium]